MMGMGGNSRKGLASVLLNDKGEATKYPELDPQAEAINPDQGLIDASAELIKAIEKKDPQRIARVFKAMSKLCYDEVDDQEEM